MRNRIAAPLLIAATVLMYLPALWNGFVYDDHFQLERNPYITDFHHLNTLLTTDVWHFSGTTKSNNYRPLHMISYLLLYKLAGLRPAIYHAAGLLFYVVSVLLFWRILHSYFESQFAFAGALLFAAHPVHVEVVAWIGGFPDLLCGLFLLLSFLFLRQNHVILSLASFLFALFSKETALVFPFIVGADFLLFRKTNKKQFKFWCTGAVILIVAYAALRIHALGSFLRTTATDIDVMLMLPAAVAFIGLYFGKLLFPHPLNAFYHYTLPLPSEHFWSGFLLAACLSVLLFAFRRNRIFLFGGIVFLIFLTPALVVKDVSPVLFAERYAYLALSGFVIAFLSLAKGGRRYLAALLIVAVVFSLITFSRTKIWRDDLTLWSDTVQKSPDSQTVNYNLATAYFKNKNYEQAAIYYARTIEIAPHKPEPYYNLAVSQYNAGRADLAEANLEAYLKYASPSHPLYEDARQKLLSLRYQKEE